MRELANPAQVYTKLMDFVAQLAALGLIHCDFNEFNVMVCACCPTLCLSHHLQMASVPATRACSLLATAHAVQLCMKHFYLWYLNKSLDRTFCPRRRSTMRTR